MKNENSAAGNRLLSMLPAKDRKRLVEECTTVDLEYETLLAKLG